MPRTSLPIAAVNNRPKRGAPPPQQKPGRRAPPPPKPELPAWSVHDPFHQPGEPATGGYIPNPPEYCDAPWVKGVTGIDWVCAAFCNSCGDRKICTGLKGYHSAVQAKNNGITHKKEWEDAAEED